MDTELQQIQENVETRLHDQEPDVELLALERPATERLRLVIDSPDGVDIALCERVTGLLRDLLEDWSLEVSSPGPGAAADEAGALPALSRQDGSRADQRGDPGQRSSFTGRLADADEEQRQRRLGRRARSTIPLAAVRRSNLLPRRERRGEHDPGDRRRRQDARAGEGDRGRHPDGRPSGRAPLRLQEDARRRQVREGRARPRERGLPRLRADGPGGPREAPARRAVRGAAPGRRGRGGGRRAHARDPDQPARRSTPRPASAERPRRRSSSPSASSPTWTRSRPGT